MISTAVLAGALWTFQACSPGAPPLALASIAYQESGYYEDSIFDNTSWQSLHYSSPSKAIEAAAALIAQGHQIDVGLLGIDFTSWTRHGVPIVAAFDNCANARLSGEILMGDYHTAVNAGYRGDTAWYQAFSLYNSGCFSPACANGRPNPEGTRYADAIFSHARLLAPDVAIAQRALAAMTTSGSTPAMVYRPAPALTPSPTTVRTSSYSAAVEDARRRQAEADARYAEIIRNMRALAHATPSPSPHH